MSKDGANLMGKLGDALLKGVKNHAGRNMFKKKTQDGQ